MNHGTAIWMYGSSARGDRDVLSDLDILVVGDMRPSMTTTIRKIIADERCPSISKYSWQEVSGMSEYGSLFLHHLRLEGFPIHEDSGCKGRLSQMLHQMGPYTKARRDVSAFKSVLYDVERSLIVGDLVAFELSVLATVIRHASILGCWLLGEPHFGRTKPVERFSTAIKTLDYHEFEAFPELYAYRLHFDRRMSSLNLVGICAELWLRRAKVLVEALEEFVVCQR